MLGAVLGGGHLEHVGDAEESLSSVAVGDHLETVRKYIFKTCYFVVFLPVRL